MDLHLKPFLSMHVLHSIFLLFLHIQVHVPGNKSTQEKTAWNAIVCAVSDLRTIMKLYA